MAADRRLLEIDYSTPPVLNDVPTFDGTKWVPSAGGGGGGLTNAYAHITGTTGTSSAFLSDTIKFESSNGVTIAAINGTPDTVTIDTPQDLQTTASPEFLSLIVNSGTSVDGGSFNILEFGNDAGVSYSGLPFRLYYDGAYKVQFDDGAGTPLNFEASYLVTGGQYVSGYMQLAFVSQGSVLFAGASGLVSQNNANFYWDDSNAKMHFDRSNIGAVGSVTHPKIQFGGSATGIYKPSLNALSIAAGGVQVLTANSTGQIAVPVTGSGAGILLGGDAQIYRSAADELRTPDGVVVDSYSAMGTTRDSRYTLKLAKTCSTNSSDLCVRADTSITGAITSAFPGAGNFSTSVNAGANTISFSTGVFFSNRSELTQSGTQTEQWGVYGDAWHRSQGNVGTLGAGKGFVNIIAGSAGTITLATGFQAVLSTSSGGTQPTITTTGLFDAQLSHSGTGGLTTVSGLRVSSSYAAASGTIGTFAGTYINDAGANATITNQYGHYIANLTRGATNRAIYIVGSGTGNSIAFNAGSVLLYSGASDRLDLATGDSLYIVNGTNGLAVGTTPNTSYTTSVLRSTAATVTTNDYAIHGQMTVSHAVTAAYPAAMRARADVSAGANTVLYHAAFQALCQITNSTSGTVSNLYGADFSVRYNTNQATASAGNIIGGAFYVTADSTSISGTISNIIGGEFNGGLPTGTTTTTISSSITGGRFRITAPQGGASGAAIFNCYCMDHSIGASAAMSTAGFLKFDALTASYGSGTKYPVLWASTATDHRQIGIWWGTDANNVSLGRTGNDALGLGSGDSFQLTAGNIITDTTTGTKIGTATTQKLGLWNATPIVQPTTAVAGATRVGGGGAALTDSDTFDGYTVAQIVKGLRNFGAFA